MLIRLGYEIAIDCPRATPLISLLEIHDERQPDIRAHNRVLTSPAVPNDVYRDLFGNACRRCRAGRVVPDPARRGDRGQRRAGRGEHARPETPFDSCPPYAWDICSKRYCETDHMGGLAWWLFGHLPPGWARVPAITDYVHDHISFGYGYARSHPDGGPGA